MSTASQRRMQIGSLSAALCIVGGKLYLNYDREEHKQWSADVPASNAKADAAWPEASKTTQVHE